MHVCKLTRFEALIEICDSYTFFKFHLGGIFFDASIVETLYITFQSHLMRQWTTVDGAVNLLPIKIAFDQY